MELMLFVSGGNKVGFNKTVNVEYLLGRRFFILKEKLYVC